MNRIKLVRIRYLPLQTGSLSELAAHHFLAKLAGQQLSRIHLSSAPKMLGLQVHAAMTKKILFPSLRQVLPILL